MCVLEAAAPRARARWPPRVRTRERFRPYFPGSTCEFSALFCGLWVPRLVFRVASGCRGFCRFPRQLAPRLRPVRWLYRLRSALHAPTAFAPRAPSNALISDCVRVRGLDSFSSACVRTPAMIFNSACRGLRQKPLDSRERVVLALAVVSLAVRASLSSRSGISHILFLRRALLFPRRAYAVPLGALFPCIKK